ncbi:MAG: hypothetical protein L0Z49_04585 [Actinobacteria bacterium]|nr:hypothetical protein [Actinomycetota bacterium]
MEAVLVAWFVYGCVQAVWSGTCRRPGTVDELRALSAAMTAIIAAAAASALVVG